MQGSFKDSVTASMLHPEGSGLNIMVRKKRTKTRAIRSGIIAI